MRKQEVFSLLLTRVMTQRSALRFLKGQASYSSQEIKQKYAPDAKKGRQLIRP